jgi:hypothetical protein
LLTLNRNNQQRKKRDVIPVVRFDVNNDDTCISRIPEWSLVLEKTAALALHGSQHSQTRNITHARNRIIYLKIALTHPHAQTHIRAQACIHILTRTFA